MQCPRDAAIERALAKARVRGITLAADSASAQSTRHVSSKSSPSLHPEYDMSRSHEYDMSRCHEYDMSRSHEVAESNSQLFAQLCRITSIAATMGSVPTEHGGVQIASAPQRAPNVDADGSSTRSCLLSLSEDSFSQVCNLPPSDYKIDYDMSCSYEPPESNSLMALSATQFAQLCAQVPERAPNADAIGSSISGFDPEISPKSSRFTQRISPVFSGLFSDREYGHGLTSYDAVSEGMGAPSRLPYSPPGIAAKIPTRLALPAEIEPAIYLPSCIPQNDCRSEEWNVYDRTPRTERNHMNVKAELTVHGAGLPAVNGRYIADAHAPSTFCMLGTYNMISLQEAKGTVPARWVLCDAGGNYAAASFNKDVKEPLIFYSCYSTGPPFNQHLWTSNQPLAELGWKSDKWGVDPPPKVIQTVSLSADSTTHLTTHLRSKLPNQNTLESASFFPAPVLRPDTHTTILPSVPSNVVDAAPFQSLAAYTAGVLPSAQVSHLEGRLQQLHHRPSLAGSAASEVSILRAKPDIGMPGQCCAETGIHGSHHMSSNAEAVQMLPQIGINGNGENPQIVFMKALPQVTSLGPPPEIRQEDEHRKPFALKHADIDGGQSKTISLPEFSTNYDGDDTSGSNGNTHISTSAVSVSGLLPAYNQHSGAVLPLGTQAVTGAQVRENL